MTSRDIVRAVCAEFGVESGRVLGQTRLTEYVVPRWVCMYLSRELLGHSFPAVGRLMGGKDHSTAILAYRRIRDRLKTDGDLAQSVARICAKLGHAIEGVAVDETPLDAEPKPEPIACVACIRRDKTMAVVLEQILSLLQQLVARSAA